MNKHAPYENEQVEGFDKLTNIEFCVDIEAILQPTQTQQLEETLQQIQTQQVSLKLIANIPKMSIYSKRSSSESMGTGDQQISLKKMNIS
jgi:hypothetical protein